MSADGVAGLFFALLFGILEVCVLVAGVYGLVRLIRRWLRRGKDEGKA
ncbi:MAG: hypothetical protein NWF14_06195 [Candidatus Bathyarchaeota archaeon]|nr:hypothetical protein [Candidatus Bathyarchaeota archaeon]